MFSLQMRLAARNMHSQYTPEWYYHNTKIAELVRAWRKTNTLTLVN